MQKGPDTVTVTVRSPREPDPKSFTWRKTTKVCEAADEAAREFGYAPGTPSFRNQNGEVLDRDKPLVAEKVEDGDELELVDIGGGV